MENKTAFKQMLKVVISRAETQASDAFADFTDEPDDLKAVEDDLRPAVEDLSCALDLNRQLNRHWHVTISGHPLSDVLSNANGTLSDVNIDEIISQDLKDTADLIDSEAIEVR